MHDFFPFLPFLSKDINGSLSLSLFRYQTHANKLYQLTTLCLCVCIYSPSSPYPWINPTLNYSSTKTSKTLSIILTKKSRRKTLSKRASHVHLSHYLLQSRVLPSLFLLLSPSRILRLSNKTTHHSWPSFLSNYRLPNLFLQESPLPFRLVHQSFVGVTNTNHCGEAVRCPPHYCHGQSGKC